MITILAKNININLLSINGLFLFFVGLIPFTTQLAGTYNKVSLAISLYALNIILIGVILLFMRVYIERSEHIDNLSRSADQRRAALIRTLLPITFAAIAIPVSFMNTNAAYVILLSGVAYNFLNNAADLVHTFIFKPVAKILR